MRVIHNDKFTPQEIESYRQLVFTNIIRGLQMLVDSLPLMGLSVSSENAVSLSVILAYETQLSNTLAVSPSIITGHF